MKVFCLVLLAGLSGCAFSEDTADVHYAPAAAAPVPGAGAITLAVADGRISNRTRISVKINGYDTEAAPIRSSRPVPDIVRDALKAEFAQRGFSLSPGHRLVTVTIRKFVNQYDIGVLSIQATGAADLDVAVSGGPAPPFQQSYQGKSYNIVLIANGSNAASSVEAALHDAMARMFADPAFVAALATGQPAQAETQ
jgi:uncharacterized lipoprotein